MEIEFNNIKNYNNIIDIRSSTSFNEYNIKGSKNIPRIILLSNPDQYMDKNNEYYIICSTGIASLSCVKTLNSIGYKCYSIRGGINLVKNSM